MQDWTTEYSDQLMCNCMLFGTDLMTGILVTLIVAGIIVGLFKSLRKKEE